MKACSKCAVEKAGDDFYGHPLSTDGLMAMCKDCHKANVKRRRKSNPAVQAYDRARGNRQRPGYVRERREKYPEMYAAHTAVGNAVRDGRLKREPCVFCGSEKVHGHHRDYKKPLEVIWLCPKCHHRLHALFPETAAHEPKS